MPIFTESDWAKLLNNISISVYMQGIPTKSKFFNNYCIITNNKNEEVVTNDSIYMLTKEKETITAHLPGCKYLVEEENQKKIIGIVDSTEQKKFEAAGYNLVDFERQTIVGDYILEGGETPENRQIHYYPQPYQKCYICIVYASVAYERDNIITGTLMQFNKETDKYEKLKTNITTLRTKYLTVLARERYNLYRTNTQFRE